MHLIPLLISTTTFLVPLATALAPKLSGNRVLFGTSGTYPRATRLSNGELLGIYTQSLNGNRILATVHSTTNGAGWSNIGSVATRPAAEADLDNGYVHQLPSGKILAAYRNHDKPTNGDYTHFRIVVSESNDGGYNWNFTSIAIEEPAGPNGVWEPFLETALDGSLQLYYSRLNGVEDQDNWVKISRDEGKTWSAAMIVSNADTRRDGMVGVARVTPGYSEKVAVFEVGVFADNHFDIYTVRSLDDGVTWFDRQLAWSAGTTINAGAPQIIRVGNRLVMSFGSNDDGGAWPDASQAMRVVVSENGGRTWADRTIVAGNPSKWAGLLALDDSSFLALYESGGTSYAQKMVFEE